MQAFCGNTIGTSYDKDEVLPHRLPLIETTCEFLARILSAALIQDDYEFRRFDLRQDFCAFGVFGDFGRDALVTLRRTYRIETKLPLPWQPLNIPIERRIYPGRLPVTDRLQANVHKSRFGGSALFFCRAQAPELFQIIKLSDARQHDVNQDILQVQ